MTQLNRSQFYFSSKSLSQNDSSRFNEPLPYIKRNTRLTPRSLLINSNYMFYKTEPVKEFNSVSVYSSVNSIV